MGDLISISCGFGGDFLPDLVEIGKILAQIYETSSVNMRQVNIINALLVKSDRDRIAMLNENEKVRAKLEELIEDCKKDMEQFTLSGNMEGFCIMSNVYMDLVKRFAETRGSRI